MNSPTNELQRRWPMQRINILLDTYIPDTTFVEMRAETYGILGCRRGAFVGVPLRDSDHTGGRVVVRRLAEPAKAKVIEE